VSHRLQFDNNWQGLTVIFSDSSVPGEGEHKILEFIRLQRTTENYDPNKSHCIYGADADLIMLSLITHEPHFFIIRESLNENQWKKCDLCGMVNF
jgi:5'-3' exonuclease